MNTLVFFFISDGIQENTMESFVAAYDKVSDSQITPDSIKDWIEHLLFLKSVDGHLGKTTRSCEASEIR